MKCLLVFFIFFTKVLFAANGQSLVVNDIHVECSNSDSCSIRKSRFLNLKGEYRSLVHLKETLRLMATDGGYQSFSYQILRNDKTYSVNIDMKIKPTIEVINVSLTDINIQFDPSQLIPLKEGEYFEAQRLKESVDGLHKKLEGLGYPYNSHTLKVEEHGDKIDISVAITLGKPRIFKKIKDNSTSLFVKDYLKRKFYFFYNKPFELNKFKLYLDDAQKELFSYGYYLINLDFVPILKNDRVVLDIKVTNDRPFAFSFVDLEHETRDEVHSLLVDMFRKYKRMLSDNIIRQAIQELYRTKARLNTKVEIKTSDFKNKFNETVTVFKIKIDEKYKTRLKSVSFVGNTFYSNEKLEEMFKDDAFELASIKLYDEEYFNYFAGKLKTAYIKEGFVQVKLLGPVKHLDTDKKNVKLEYVIQEGPRALVRSITFEGVPHEAEESILSKLNNRVSRPFNPITLVDDIKKVSTILQESGYYFAEVTNANNDELVQYSRSGTDVDIHLIVNPGPIVRLNKVIFLGNDKTIKKVLKKKISLKEGDFITPSKTREIESALSATGLFNTVSVQPVRHHSKNTATDLVVKVLERDYGLIELAPGFRTDIGLKLTATASYLNIGGRNMAVTLRSQVNQRLTLYTLDPARREQNRKILEFNNSLIYNWGDIFDTQVDFSASATYQRKRFYSFDADIQRYNTTFTRLLAPQLSTSARYQYEDIKQYNSTLDKDSGRFKIGAITPGLTWDLRNSTTLPTKGAFFNASCEFGNPYFGSQKDTDLTINFYKLVSRNRFYIPYNRGTLAISAMLGVEKNLASGIVKDSNGVPEADPENKGRPRTEGYIPNIKVFRLTGMDIVRGYSDEEINRLPNGNDITDEKITNKAYIALFKVEPRFLINDNLMTGLFIDAGRVYKDTMNLSELRSSVGVTFKVLTPVGTLDFDYGVKTQRERNKDGSLESPGRFHVSIGFF